MACEWCNYWGNWGQPGRSEKSIVESVFCMFCVCVCVCVCAGIIRLENHLKIWLWGAFCALCPRCAQSLYRTMPNIVVPSTRKT